MRLDPITLINSKLLCQVDAFKRRGLKKAVQPLKSKLICSMNFDELFNFEQLITQVMPDDHSKLVPLLPIPNRKVKRLCADDSADSRVKVGHCQAFTALNKPSRSSNRSTGLFFVYARATHIEPVAGHGPTCCRRPKFDYLKAIEAT